MSRVQFNVAHSSRAAFEKACQRCHVPILDIHASKAGGKLHITVDIALIGVAFFLGCYCYEEEYHGSLTGSFPFAMRQTDALRCPNCEWIGPESDLATELTVNGPADMCPKCGVCSEDLEGGA